MKLSTFILQLVATLGGLCLGGSKAYSTTRVGNGGDIIDGYLGNTRHILIETMDDIVNYSPRQQIRFCDSVEQLTAEEKQFCNEIIWKIKDKYRSEIIKSPPTPFELSSAPLFARDFSGTLRPVLAITTCDPNGKIIFHYDSIKNLSPENLLKLLAHEYFHKISLNNDEQCMQDNISYGPFAEPGGGRRLIDALATAIAKSAMAKGQVRKHLEIVDVFNCNITDITSGLSFPSLLKAPRILVKKGNLGSYSAGVGLWQGESECEISEIHDNAKVTFQLQIEERTDCLEDDARGRKTTLLLTRKRREGSGHLFQEPEILQMQTLDGVNPLCFWSQHQKVFTSKFILSRGRPFEFSLTYKNSILR